MNTSAFTNQVSELRWLVTELGTELETLETTTYPHAHRLLMRGLLRRIALVAQRTSEVLSQSTPTPVTCPEEVQPIEEQPA